MKFALSLLLTLLLVLAPLQVVTAAESLSEGTPDRLGGEFWYVDITWTADSDGTFDTLQTEHSYAGFLRGVGCWPGTTAPTDASDLDVYFVVNGTTTATEVLSTDGDDLLDATSTTFADTGAQVLISGPMAIDVENNVVANATGTCRFYFRLPGNN